jgi:hypothetical protein
MKKKLLSVSLFFIVLCCSGQQPDTIDLTWPVCEAQPIRVHREIPGNSIYLDIGGHLALGSLNYERILFHARDFYLSARIGAGYIPPSISTISLIGLVNGIYQVSDVFCLEIGFGVAGTYTYWKGYYTESGTDSDTIYHPADSFIDPVLTGFAGIRVQKKKGFLFRFGLTPMIELTDDIEHRTVYKQLEATDTFIPWLGMSFGYSF